MHACAPQPLTPGGAAGPTTKFRLNTQLYERDLVSLAGNALLFFEAQRSGELPPDNRVPWRGDSSLFDGQQHAPTLNLTGGWHDAGGSIKASMPFCASVRTLCCCQHPTLMLSVESQSAYAPLPQCV